MCIRDRYTIEINSGIYDAVGQQADGKMVYSFTTQERGVAAAKPVFGGSSIPSAGGRISVGTDIFNASDETQKVSLIAAQYDLSLIHI